MRQTYFNVKIEFDQQKVDEIIQTTISKKGKGYVCSIESNNLTVANTSPDFLKVVNNALVNICDGSILASLIGRLNRQPFVPYIGADFFIKYIQQCKYKQLYLGNTSEILDGLRKNLSEIDPHIRQMPFEELPFASVDQFDYVSIAQMINRQKPDIIWVSLGAPKQEYFMERLLPHINQGVMFGFGAIFNFYSGVGKVKRAPMWMRRHRLEWLYRAWEDPQKNVPRYWGFIRILPRLIFLEIRKTKSSWNITSQSKNYTYDTRQ